MENKKVEKDFIVMIGMSLSGKTYHVDFNYLPGYQLLSSNHYKQAFKTTKISNPNIVYAAMELTARSHMIKGLPIVVDESNLDVDSLFLWKSMAREFGYNIKGVLIDTPLDVCTARLKYFLKGEPISEEMHNKLTKEHEKIEELKTLLKMKHQNILDAVLFINYDGG